LPRIYINSTYALKTGDQLIVDGTPYVIVAPGLIHLYAVHQDETKHWLPYSKILKADLTFVPMTSERP
jgi:hypothetical protein